ncbi:hypothetical protein Hypma_016004 [Hypsizygus marmoreus]|uniref:UBC core domain-containing protein n=1 Tax=Hypsizygus marmoreus TaxID=39966 RepID=A0A369K234_HYPMA|nr:hypothetical protein Hypma_016004 [Hypsizygus marmoreus]
MAPSSKRKSGPLGSSENAKRARKPPVPLPSEVIEIDDSDDEDDFGAVLAHIKQQEENERRIQKSHNAAGPSNAIVIDDVEGDEAMAHRLAREWVIARQAQSFDIEIVELKKPSFPSAGRATVTKEPPKPRRRARSPNPVETKPPDQRLSEFRDLFTGTRDCSKCGKPVVSPRGFVMFKGDATPPPSLTALLHAPCSSCCTNHCRGCFTPLTCTMSCKGHSKTKICAAINCCAAGRAIAIFETLGGFDRQIIGEQATSESRAQAAIGKAKSNHATVGPGGTGYGTGSGYYGGRGRGLSSSAPQRNTRAEGLAKHWEEIVVRALTTLTDLLPSPYSDDVKEYDLVPHSCIGLLISLSKLPDLLASLLRNDSVMDWIARSKTYHAMLTLLRRMADCELTVKVLLERRWEMTKTPGLQIWMWNEGEVEFQKEQDSPDQPPLYDYFKKLIKQSETFMATASHMMDTEANGGDADSQETTAQAVSLCGDVIAAGGDIERVVSVLGIAPSPGEQDGFDNGKGKAREDPLRSLDRIYAEACERLAFKHISLAQPEDQKGKRTGLVYANFTYSQNLTQTQSSTRNPKSHFRLASELAVMATSLPPGVWVRVDEVRNDAIKIMIAGPEGTPYAGGLFEFDCFMPLEYPNTPPLVNLRTTGGGTVRFNPNLYNCGKVCLSLLGTWAGRPEEQWSTKSTLLQVIISIQSMILVDAPYFNEPGYGKANLKAPASIAYNRDVSLNTVRWAIVEWLQDEHLNGIWGEVIRSHFGIKKAYIRDKILEWAAVDFRMQAYSSASSGHNQYHMAGSTIGGAHINSFKGDLIKEYDLRMTRLDS